MANTLAASSENEPAVQQAGVAARLVLTVGSNAGLEAPLQPGYYMIGRHAECQIRPKSRSVSRRHCLLFLDDTGLQVFDLASASGTRVNDLRLREKTWHRLRTGDMLRLGKVVFEIRLPESMASIPAAERASSIEPVARATAGAGATHDGIASEMPVGEAWHDVDIAGFLGDEDDADRERRYDSIRTASHSNLEDSADDFEATVVDEAVLFDDPIPGAAANVGEEAVGVPVDDDEIDESGGATKKDGKSKKKRKKRSALRDIPKPKKQRSSRSLSLPSFSGGIETWKRIGIGVVVIASVAGLGYSAMQFYNGPEVRVIENID